MKIKHQFDLLVGGIILIPLLVIILQFLFWRLQREESHPVIPVYEKLTPMLRSTMNSKEWKIIRSLVLRLRPNTDIVLFHEDMTVIYSSIEGFLAGKKMKIERVYSLLQGGNPRYGYTFESAPWLREGRVFILLRNDREARSVFPPSSLIIRSLLFVVFGLFSFVFVMSLLITRSFTRSVLILEDTTRRIAAGELDLNVEISKTEFLRKNNEITSLAASLNRMRLALKEEEQRRSRFIMGISHDLKTPLTLIKGHAEAIEDGVTTGPAQGRSLKIIIQRADQLEGMIDDLVNFVRIDTRAWRLRLSRVKLRGFLAAYGRWITDESALLKRRVEWTLDLPEELSVPMDEGLVTRALENLMSNALRYTPEGGLVWFRAYLKKTSAAKTGASGGKYRIIIEVEDNGPGIAGKDLPHVFDIFYRGDNSRRQQGMGLGLSVVKGVVDSHGWELTVESPTGSGETGGPGTRFRIII
ncbi:MAG: HAMP domain-containing histidine kinase [Treponema sp.]|jgi:signal transduction histidine kinase|nr:HAMP domain-containing histidine kinase [Treponema sp.]